MLNEALRLPYRATDATGTLLVGSVLTGLTGVAVIGWLTVLVVAPLIGAAVTPVVFLLSLIVRGYLLRVVAAGISGRTTAPSFVRWGSLLRDGARSAIVSTSYLLPGTVFAGLAGGAIAATIIDPPGFTPALQAIAALAILVGGFGTLCYGLVYLYLRGAGRAVLAATGSVRAALDIRRVVRLSASGSYLGGWLVAMGLLLVGPLLVTPLVVVSILVGFYDPVLTAVGGLITVVLTVVLVFSARISAAWATGRGAAPGLGIDRPAVDDGAVTPPVSTEPPELSERPPEAPAAVQVGRTVTSLSTTPDSDSREIDANEEHSGFPMPGTPLTDGTGTGYSEEPAGDPTTTDEQSNPDDESETNNGTEASEQRPTDDSGTATDVPEADGGFEWGVVEEA